MAVERVGEPSTERWVVDAWTPPLLQAAEFDRTLDVGWRRASYSSITRALHDHPVVGSEPERQLTTDEDLPVAPTARVRAVEAPDRTVALRLADMPGGALVGTVFHGVF